MPHRTPLTAARLAEIWDDHPYPVVLELLWEIHRLRATIRRADQVRQMLGPHGSHGIPETVWGCFVRELDAEPCLTDPPTPRQQAIVDNIVTSRQKTRR